MTRMTGPDCAVLCYLINIHTHTAFQTAKDFSPMYDSVDPGIIRITVYTTNLGWFTFTYVKVVLSLFPSPAPIVPWL